MSDDFESFEDEADEDGGFMWKMKASTRAMVDVIYEHNLEGEVEALYEIYAIEEKAKWEEWFHKIDEKRK
jgi:hypothetical protein